MNINISKRKLESYKRAEIVARELRYQLTDIRKTNQSKLADAVISWMRVTGNIKYKVPKIREVKL